jgi:hypothetical protein
VAVVPHPQLDLLARVEEVEIAELVGTCGRIPVVDVDLEAVEGLK